MTVRGDQPFRFLRAGNLALVTAILLTTEPAGAADLDWSAPPGCGDAASVVAQVEQLTQQPLSAVEDADFSVHIEPGPGGQWRLLLRTSPRPSGPETVRELQGASCEEAKDAAAISIAMAINLRPDPEPQPAPQAPTDLPQSEPQPPPSAAPAEPQEAALRWTIALGLALDLGTLPALAPGASLELALGFSLLRFGAIVALFPAQEARLDGGELGADMELASAALQACVEPTVGQFRLAGCAGFEIGQLWASSVGVEPEVDAQQLRYGPRAELGVAWPTSSMVRIWSRIGGVFAQPQDWFTVNDEQLHEPAFLALRMALGVEIQF